MILRISDGAFVLQVFKVMSRMLRQSGFAGAIVEGMDKSLVEQISDSAKIKQRKAAGTNLTNGGRQDVLFIPIPAGVGDTAIVKELGSVRGNVLVIEGDPMEETNKIHRVGEETPLGVEDLKAIKGPITFLGRRDTKIHASSPIIREVVRRMPVGVFKTDMADMSRITTQINERLRKDDRINFEIGSTRVLRDSDKKVLERMGVAGKLENIAIIAEFNGEHKLLVSPDLAGNPERILGILRNETAPGRNGRWRMSGGVKIISTFR